MERLGQVLSCRRSPMALADCPTEVALKQGRIAQGQEAIIERKDGTRIPIIPYPTPLRDETGAIVGVVNMTVDISERKKAELALAERNIQLALAGRCFEPLAAGLTPLQASNSNSGLSIACHPRSATQFSRAWDRA